MLIVDFIQHKFKDHYSKEHHLTLDSLNFNSGESYYKIPDNYLEVLKDSQTNEVHIKWYYKDDSELMVLSSLVDHIRLLRNKIPIKFYMPYFPHSRMDRFGSESMPFSLMSFIKLLSSVGIGKVYTCNPHSDVTLKLLHNSGIDYEFLSSDFSFDKNTNFVFPDKGASLRYKDAGFENVSIMKKVRDFGTGKIVDLDFEIDNINPIHNVIILDDICSYGGTFVKTIDKLLERYPDIKNIMLFVDHLEESYRLGKLPEYLKRDDINFRILSKITMDWQIRKAVKDEIDLRPVHLFQLDKEISDKVLFTKVYKHV